MPTNELKTWQAQAQAQAKDQAKEQEQTQTQEQAGWGGILRSYTRRCTAPAICRFGAC